MHLSSLEITYEFVEYLPAELENGILYISVNYSTAAHMCCCGCGHEVVTPFSPSDWRLVYDGESVSLSPSIGNWSFKCKSHYWIKNNKVLEAAPWTSNQIKSNRALDLRRKNKLSKQVIGGVKEEKEAKAKPKRNIIGKLFNLFRW